MPQKKDKRIGNDFWKKRSSHGRKPIFENTDQLLSACEEYFQWNEQNPLYKTHVFQYQGKVVTKEVPLMRAMSIHGLCTFLDISVQTWHDYKKRDGFLEVITHAEKIMFTQKFEGASAELLNSNIIARDLGLKDKQETEHTGQFTITRRVIKGKAPEQKETTSED